MIPKLGMTALKSGTCHLDFLTGYGHGQTTLPRQSLANQELEAANANQDEMANMSSDWNRHSGATNPACQGRGRVGHVARRTFSVHIVLETSNRRESLWSVELDSRHARHPTMKHNILQFRDLRMSWKYESDRTSCPTRIRSRMHSKHDRCHKTSGRVWPGITS
jgi:hypothetical protein